MCNLSMPTLLLATWTVQLRGIAGAIQTQNMGGRVVSRKALKTNGRRIIHNTKTRRDIDGQIRSGSSISQYHILTRKV